ncbi:uncharacterized protein TNCV_4410111 [Trichonephila clavipes]|nr:uncharacterized protein TNCV_4410111 [Trichonephila clavipes]
MRARNYCAHHNTRDHWTLRCMNRCPDLVVCLKRDLQCLRPEASLVLIYRPKVAEMKGRVDLAQPVNRTQDLCKKPHTIAKELILPAAIEIVETMFGDIFAKQLQSIRQSNDNVSRRIDDIAEDVEQQLSDRVVVYSASTPQVWGSINGLRKVDSAFHPRYIGSINEYQACFGAAERRPVRSKQATAARPCPYYPSSRVRQLEGFPEERMNSGLAIIPQNNIRRRSLSMEALDGDPVDRSE